MELLQPFAINEVLTPNLYQMTQTGLYFENSYSENKTNISKLISIIGNQLTILTLNPNLYNYDNSYSFSMLLRDEIGYATAYSYDNLPSFYSRGNLMMIYMDGTVIILQIVTLWIE